MPDKVDVISKLWGENQNTLNRLLLSHICNINQLVDMDWRFAVTAATTDEDKKGHTFLQIKFVLNKGSNQCKIVCVEFTLPQFYSFLHQMEKAKSNLELLF